MSTKQACLRAGTWFAILVMFACGDKITVPPAATTPSPTAGTNVLSVTVSPGSVTLNPGDRITLVASVNAEAGVTDRTVTWSSSNTAIASVDANGVVTAGTTAGNATITAASRANTAVRGAAIVTVTAPSTPPTTTTTTTTNYSVTLTVTSDPAGHEPFTRYTTVRSITAEVTGSTIRITGASPWVTVSGTLSASGSFTASGSGTVAGNPNVTVTFAGTQTAQGISGAITLGPGLPNNQNESLSITGSRQ